MPDRSNLIVGTDEPATEDRPARQVIQGVNFDSNVGRYVDYVQNNHWQYRCNGCGIGDPDISYFSQRCGGWICRDCSYVIDHENGPIPGCDCEQCQDDQYRADNIEEWNYSPSPLFFRTDSERRSAKKIVTDIRKKSGLYARSLSEHFAFDQDRTPFLSFELEVENTSGQVNNGEAVSNVTYEWSYAKYDGSLETGFEIVSHPFTFDYFTGPMLEDWQRTLRSLKADGFNSYKTESCGMHVHISKAAFTNYHLYRFLRIWYFSKRFTLWLSKRSPESFDQWAGFNKNGPYPIVQKAKAKYYPEKYEAVNLAHPASVEIRIFRGTLHPDSFRRNIETVHAAYQFSDPYSADKVRTAEITPEGFAKFVRVHKKTYPQLFDHFWDHGHVVSEIESATPEGSV